MLGSGFYTVTGEGGRAVVLRRSRRIMQKDPVDYTVFFSRIIKRKPRYQKVQIMKKTTRQRIPVGPQDEDFEGMPHTGNAHHFLGPFCQCARLLQEQAETSIVPQPRPAQVVNVKDTKKRRGRPKKRKAPTSAQSAGRRRMPEMESPVLRYEGCDPNILTDADPSPRAMLPHSSFEIVESDEDDMNIFMENNDDTAYVPIKKIPVLVRHTTTVQELGPKGEFGLQDMGDHHFSPSAGSANSPLPEPDNIAHTSGNVLRDPPSFQSISDEILDFNSWTPHCLTPGGASQSTTDPESTQGTSTQDQASAPAERSKKTKKKARK